MHDEEQAASERRAFLRQAAALAGAVVAGGVAAPAGTDAAVLGADIGICTPGPPGVPGAPATSGTHPPSIVEPAPAFPGYEFFGPEEAAFVEALVNLMCPADAYTPNGVDCGLAVFFDRQLAGPFGQGKGRYLRGPWNEGPPQMGPQLPLTPAQYFLEGLRAANLESHRLHGKPFDQLDPAQGEAFLHLVESAPPQQGTIPLADWFNSLVYPLFVQACFADPLYGGNHDKVFWKLVGYPGLPATHALDMVRYRGKPYPGAATPRSIGDFS
ncbi:MAG: gluconate 2-dehydrogenase subunit 3 family protein [Steroidobacteraceae bacterium]